MAFDNKILLLRMVDSGKVSIFDEFLNPEKSITNGYQLSNFLMPLYSKKDRVFIIKENKIEEIPIHRDFSFNFIRTKSILKYLNERYQTKFTGQSFSTNKEMFAYISEHG